MNVLDKYARAVSDLKDAHMYAAKAEMTFGNTFRERVKDLSMIKTIHEWYIEVARANKFRADGTVNNKQFLFLVLNLYSPAALIGGNIKKDLRKAVATALGIKADTAIYKMRSTAVAWYATYPKFRNETNTAIVEIERALSKKFLL